MANSLTRSKDLNGGYDLLGSHRLEVSTGAVTVIAARTATAGQLLSWRWPGAATSRCYIKYIGARFIATTAYTTAQETGCDLILARSFTVNGTNGTAVDVGSTVADTNVLATSHGTSLITAGCVRVATTAVVTAGAHTLDANPLGSISGWTSAIGVMVPEASVRAQGDGYGPLWDCDHTTHRAPIVLATDEGFVIRNKILMGAVGVGRWDFVVEWDEGVPHA